MSEDKIFDYLVMGLNQWLAQDLPYPYPDCFRRACHQLALAMDRLEYPCTMAGLLALFERPMRDWYPCKVPEGFHPDFGLVDDGHLSEEASQYLYDEMETSGVLHGDVSTRAQQQLREHFQFQKLFGRLREQYQAEPKNAQKIQEEYILLRKFLIEHPFTTTTQLRQTFGIHQANYFETQEVDQLYDRCSETEIYWKCDRCGPLFEKHGTLRGYKPSVCNDHLKSHDFVHKIQGTRELLKIKRGIHLRVCLPGIPELDLFRRLNDFAEEHPNVLCDIYLYPGLDQYDLQIRFIDKTVWAVDVKDYLSPHTLAPKLSTLYREGALAYTLSGAEKS